MLLEGRYSLEGCIAGSLNREGSTGSRLGPARFMAVQDEVGLLLNSQKGPAACVAIPAVALCELASAGVVLRANVVARLRLRQVGRHHTIGRPDPLHLVGFWPRIGQHSFFVVDADQVLTAPSKEMPTAFSTPANSVQQIRRELPWSSARRNPTNAPQLIPTLASPARLSAAQVRIARMFRSNLRRDHSQCLAWALEKDAAVVPISRKEEHMRQNPYLSKPPRKHYQLMETASEVLRTNHCLQSHRYICFDIFDEQGQLADDKAPCD